MNNAPKTIKTTLVGFCYPCQRAHIKEQTIKESGGLYCRRTGFAMSINDSFKPPIPIEVPQEDIDEALEDLDEPKEPKKNLVQPSRTEQIIEHLEMVATIFDVDIDQHSEAWKSIVEQFLSIANVKEAKITSMPLRETK